MDEGMSTYLELPDRITRREFLNLSSMSLLALAMPVRWLRPQVETPYGQLGRVVEPTVGIHLSPSFASSKLKNKWRDDLLTLVSAVVGDDVPEHNRIWYEVPGEGYVHSSGVQPVRDEPNEPLESVPSNGSLMEVTIPFVDVHWWPRSNSDKAYRFYYGSTHWVVGVNRDVSLKKWYRIYDDRYAYHYYAPATAFRRVPTSELIPISPEVPDNEKRIEVNLAKQWVQCYEGSDLVFTTKVSTGRKFEGEVYWTPEGEFVTYRKRPSRHMAAGNLASGYDLPGVPWVAYINEAGVSFHGTYWHNDYGVPRSHGCINMTPQAAKWLYRWTHPVVPSYEQEIWVDYGTSVDIYIQA